MIDVLDAAVEVDAICQNERFAYCVLGEIALQRWGQPRTTSEVNVTVHTSFGNEAPIVDSLLTTFSPRISSARQFALQRRVVLLKRNGVRIDVTLGALPFEARIVERSSVWQLDDTHSIRTCSAEDLVVQKAFAGREQDWLDIRYVIQRQKQLNSTIILDEMQDLLHITGDDTGKRRLQELLQMN